MSMNTSYRYEIERPGAKNLRKALERQEQRIKNDEWSSERDASIKNNIRVNLIADWAEKLEETSARRTVRRWHDETKQELALTNKELTDVRKAQLRKLLNEEHYIHQQELNAMGKAYYTQRT
ncbi:hypothetical protein QZH41_016372 [Actinostola sp. cb2023]|nr:hypothetical protein QZH41_016372 [Actinostola sp. cb2023]